VLRSRILPIARPKRFQSTKHGEPLAEDKPPQNYKFGYVNFDATRYVKERTFGYLTCTLAPGIYKISCFNSVSASHKI